MSALTAGKQGSSYGPPPSASTSPTTHQPSATACSCWGTVGWSFCEKRASGGTGKTNRTRETKQTYLQKHMRKHHSGTRKTRPTGGTCTTLRTMEAEAEATCKVLLPLKMDEPHENSCASVFGHLKNPWKRCKSKGVSPVPYKHPIRYLRRRQKNIVRRTQHRDTRQHTTTQHNIAQHNTTQHNTTQHNTTQHNTT